jgi:hypothetical protein
MTEFEKAISSLMFSSTTCLGMPDNIVQRADYCDEQAKKQAPYLLSLAKREFYPRWKKSKKDDPEMPYNTEGNIHYPTGRLFIYGYEISIDDLFNNLPKED